MIKLPREMTFEDALHECKGMDGVIAKSFQVGVNWMRSEVQRLNATAQPVSDGCKVPEGWKLVPIEPTEEMISAWREDMGRSYAEYYAEKIGDDEIVFSYQAMLAAAPGGSG